MLPHSKQIAERNEDEGIVNDLSRHPGRPVHPGAYPLA
jgi:hypothetical protein